MFIAVHAFSRRLVQLMTTQFLRLVTTQLRSCAFLFVLFLVFYFDVLAAKVAHSGSGSAAVFVLRNRGIREHIFAVLAFTRTLHTIFNVVCQFADWKGLLAVLTRCLGVKLALSVKEQIRGETTDRLSRPFWNTAGSGECSDGSKPRASRSY